MEFQHVHQCCGLFCREQKHSTSNNLKPVTSRSGSAQIKIIHPRFNALRQFVGQQEEHPVQFSSVTVFMFHAVL